jgi:hypothetical protein
MPAFAVDSICGLRRTPRSSGVCSIAAAKSESASLTCASRPLSFAASNRASA